MHATSLCAMHHSNTIVIGRCKVVVHNYAVGAIMQLHHGKKRPKSLSILNVIRLLLWKLTPPR